MAELTFEWDQAKSRANRLQHGVSFDEAQTVFTDELGLIIHDPDHSGDVIRIISARKANRKEQPLYAHRRKP